MQLNYIFCTKPINNHPSKTHFAQNGFYRNYFLLLLYHKYSKNHLKIYPVNRNNSKSKKLSAKQQTELMSVLKTRFEKNRNRHKGIVWDEVQRRLDANTQKTWSLYEMEESGGEPDVVGRDKTTGEFIFYDCSAESPKGRRSICYDHEALEKRKENKPGNSAMEMAKDMGIEILTEEQYRALQQLGAFDLKTRYYQEIGRGHFLRPQV
jgi:hypothetical protein